VTSNGLPTSVRWPAHWGSAPLWALFDRIKDVGHPDEEMLSVYREHGVVKKSSRDDNANQTAEDRNIYQLIDEGWFVVNRMKAWQGSVGISPLKGIVSGHYLCFRPKHREDPRFLNWLLRSEVYAVEYARMSRGVRPGQIEIDNDDLRGLRIALPPRDEQHRIADFLNAVTAQMDRLRYVRDHQEVTLAELASSTVSAVVPNESEASFVRLGYLATVQMGITVDSRREQQIDSMTLPYLRVANVQDGYVDLKSVSEITVPIAAARSAMLKYGDVLMTEGGDLDKLGRGTVWLDEIKNCLHQNHVFAVRTDQRKLHPEYLALITRTAYARSYFERTGTKTTNLASTSSSKIRDFRVPLIDIAAQIRVCRETDERLKDIRKLEAALSRQRVLLAERRQALINAAVTGQINATAARGDVVATRISV
jgi:type I restriction enzyme, S subunit